jgi:hypothetical protein
MTLLDVHTADGAPSSEALRIAGALEDASEHPIANAITRAAREKFEDLPPVEDFANLEGLGAQGVVDAMAVVIGRERLLADWAVQLLADLAASMRQAESEGKTAVAVAWDGKARAVLVVADTVRPTSADAIRQTRKLGETPIMLTGDNEAAAATMGARWLSTRSSLARCPATRSTPSRTAGPGQGGRDGGRRRQRRGGPGPARSRTGDGLRYRRGHRGERPDSRSRRSTCRAGRNSAFAQNIGQRLREACSGRSPITW